MATKIASAAEIAKKWTDVTSQRGAYYQAGVANAGQDWENNTKAAKTAYQSAVTAGNIGNMFVGGVAKAGTAKYQRKASGVGKDRFAGGVQAATSDMQTGIEPFVQVIAGVTPPARGPRGAVSNQTRSTVYQTALHNARIAMHGGGA